ncbi:cobalamin biosynthesis protein CobG [Sphingobium sp. AR-3-1]|uniref:Cobalamin biosynthesis protein CobG n=1 Tax=Sphingobium psychrophilum TaxID=2728834 RepID=A0A7X9WVB6_9SPHN|nr:cobalamin biosynthesis protein CobG [Sphingobium psychrophilum]NML10591.1 cobalamin biosynthesis protein CobG [Sphingobium psychrophilum]
MSDFIRKGWCPDAWRPMMAGDGLLVRVKPRLGRLTRDQAAGLANAAATHGNGLIDMTRRANLQLRGVSESGWRVLLDRLLAMDLVDAGADHEKRRNILVSPTWRLGDDSHRIADDLLARLDDLPAALPGKVGFVIDAGAAPLLHDQPGDFRIERSDAGDLMLRADGRSTGCAVALGGEADALIALAHWFVASGGAAAGRMARHDAPLPGWAEGALHAAAAILPWGRGTSYGLPFGRIDAALLARLAKALPQCSGLRTTPWRILLLEAPVAMQDDGLLTDPADPLLRVDACPGQPACAQASVETRDLARRLAPHMAGRLHVSGCAKSCASAAPAAVTLTGRHGRYDLALDARAGSPPLRAALDRAAVLSHFGAA